MEDIFGGG
jgi:hypothetical protein